MDLYSEAKKNIETRFADNPSRMIIGGILESGNQVQLVAMGGRSKESQEREYRLTDEHTARTFFLDPTKNEDPLRNYNAMRTLGERAHIHVAGNGDQTDTVYKGLKPDRTPFDSLDWMTQQRYCEPDASVFTPRITVMQQPHRPMAHFSVLRADPSLKSKWLAAQRKIEQHQGLEHNQIILPDNPLLQQIAQESGIDPNKFPTVRDTFPMRLQKGLGYCVTTYNPGDSRGLPAFTGKPFPVLLEGTLEETMARYLYEVLDKRVTAIAGKEIRADGFRFAEPLSRFG